MTKLERQIKEAKDKLIVIQDEILRLVTLRERDHRSYETIKPSLDQALQEASGVPFAEDKLRDMSAYELLTILGCNSIVFQYVGNKNRVKLSYKEVSW